jgi:hypothetical protein
VGGQEAERRTGETGRFSVVRPDIENRPEAGYNNNSMMILSRGRRFQPLPQPRSHERAPGIHPGFLSPNQEALDGVESLLAHYFLQIAI